MASLMMIYGGRAAEEVVFGQDKVTSGAQADLREATRIARAMVFDYGMGRDSAGKILAPLMWPKDMRGHLLPSINTQEKLEIAVESLAIETYAAAVELINNNRNALESLADALISRETLGGDEVRSIVSCASQQAGEGT
jgi:cell division protease FtsH